MLNPDTRTLLRDALRPPAGFDVESVIATTFSLDLTALLLAPVSFARLNGFIGDARAATPVDDVDPLALLKAIRSYAERTTVFCQSGRISVPKSYHRLHTYLEGSVVEVNSPGGGVFHPKVWVLRMTGPDAAVRYRLLVLSRNLTFDTSWDTCLSLDGELDQQRQRAFAQNHPLADFVAALPGLAVKEVSPALSKRVARVAEELRRVHFELPDDFDELEFAPIGVGDFTGMPFSDSRASKRLVISPFVRDGALRDLPGEKGTLVSRTEELDQLAPETIALFEQVFVLNEAAEQLGDDELASTPSSEWSPPPSGLHAKVFLFDDGWNAQLWSGSANATIAAFAQNVEFLVRLQGKKAKVGVDALLAPGNGAHALLELLEPYRGTGRASAALTEEQKLEAELHRLRLQIARRAWVASASQRPDGGFTVALRPDTSLGLPPHWKALVRPVTLPPGHFTALGADSSASFDCSFEALTAFFCVRLERESVSDEFVVTATLEGAPDNRVAQVLESILSNPSQLLRFIRLLLADDGFETLRALEAGDGAGSSGASSQQRREQPLLESMLRALAEEPERLDALERLMTDLGQLRDGLKKLPPGFLAAWEPIRAARARLGRKP